MPHERSHRREKAESAERREESYRAMSEQLAFALGTSLIERGDEILAIDEGGAEQLLASSAESQQPWFAAWTILRERAPKHIAERVLLDSRRV